MQLTYFAAVLHHMQRIAGFDRECYAETSADLEALEDKIAELEARIDALEERLERTWNTPDRRAEGR